MTFEMDISYFAAYTRSIHNVEFVSSMAERMDSSSGN